MDWSLSEVELVVADYFAMFAEVKAGRRVNKRARNTALQPLLNGRTAASVEFKRRNISAVLDEFGLGYLAGYRPAPNYQELLAQAVLEWLGGAPEVFDGLTSNAAIQQGMGNSQPVNDILSIVEPPPRANDPLAGALVALSYSRAPRVIDFVAKDSRNLELGRKGEEFVHDFECRRLHDIERRADLAKRVEWVAQTRGDGLGYDIESFNGDGSTRLIEVKTTDLGKGVPFYVSANEVAVSEAKRDRYHVYRVFDFSKSRRMYQLQGALSTVCTLEPTIYKAWVG